MVMFTNTRFELVYDDCFFFCPGNQFIFTLEGESNHSFLKKKKREKKRQVTILVQEKMKIDLFG